MATQKCKNILIAPLDWGLGHTTRCVPLIAHLQQLGHRPIVAGNAQQLSFIKDTFGSIATTLLPGYGITYSRWNRYAQAGLLAQLPHILAAVAAEQRWLLAQAAQLGLHGIISDNRYGLHHSHIPSVIITHQLRVLTGMGALADRAVQRLHYQYLSRFGGVWVPDVAEGSGLAGIMSHPPHLPAHTAYIGLLSRFAPVRPSAGGSGPLLILLSGPEPQRTNLERLLWQQLLHTGTEAVFVAGSDKAIPPSFVPPNITYHSRLTHSALLPLLQAARLVICRSGYSTIMDIAALHKKAILLPTPGQTEQQYLAHKLHQQGIYMQARQNGFNLQQALQAAAQFPFTAPGTDGEFGRYRDVLEQWCGQL